MGRALPIKRRAVRTELIAVIALVIFTAGIILGVLWHDGLVPNPLAAECTSETTTNCHVDVDRLGQQSYIVTADGRTYYLGGR